MGLGIICYDMSPSWSAKCLIIWHEDMTPNMHVYTFIFSLPPEFEPVISELLVKRAILLTLKISEILQFLFNKLILYISTFYQHSQKILTRLNLFKNWNYCTNNHRNSNIIFIHLFCDSNLHYNYYIVEKNFYRSLSQELYIFF